MAMSFRNREVDVLGGRGGRGGGGSSSPHTVGFWGEVTASLDWCEDNYEMTYFMAEFWNTISNLAFIIPSLVAAWHVYKHGFEMRFALAHLSVGLIGIGSALYHLTLKRTMQLADELPMLYGTAMLLYCALEAAKPKAQVNKPLAAALIVTTTITTAAYVLQRDPTIFFGMYTALTSAVIVLGLRVMYKHGGDGSRWIGVSGMASYAAGFCLWSFENSFCATVQSVRQGAGPVLGVFTQLHAWWHVLAACGGYLLVLSLLHVRLAMNASASSSSSPPRLGYRWRVLPLVETDHAKPSFAAAWESNGSTYH